MSISFLHSLKEFNKSPQELYIVGFEKPINGEKSFSAVSKNQLLLADTKLSIGEIARKALSYKEEYSLLDLKDLKSSLSAIQLNIEKKRSCNFLKKYL